MYIILKILFILQIILCTFLVLTLLSNEFPFAMKTGRKTRALYVKIGNRQALAIESKETHRCGNPPGKCMNSIGSID